MFTTPNLAEAAAESRIGSERGRFTDPHRAVYRLGNDYAVFSRNEKPSGLGREDLIGIWGESGWSAGPAFTPEMVEIFANAPREHTTSHATSFRLNRGALDQLQDLAIAENRSKSNMLAELIARAHQATLA